MSATHTAQSNTTAAPVLYLALELSWNAWKLAFTSASDRRPDSAPSPPATPTLLLAEIAKAKARFGLPEDTPVVSCYEAGRDGFWLHRFLVHEGIDDRVVNSASIEVNRRHAAGQVRRASTPSSSWKCSSVFITASPRSGRSSASPPSRMRTVASGIAS